MISHFFFPTPQEATGRAFGADDGVVFDKEPRLLVKNVRFLMSAYNCEQPLA